MLGPEPGNVLGDPPTPFDFEAGDYTQLYAYGGGPGNIAPVAGPLKILAYDPNDSAYGTLVADIFTQRGARTLAIQEYEKVLQLAGERARAPVHHELGLLYEGEERYEEAISQYEFAVGKDSTFAPAWKSMATLLGRARGKEKEAAATYLRYTQLRADDPEGFLGLAKAALIYLTEALAVELAPHVTVNAIAPGQIEDSELIDQIDPNFKRILREESPLKRLVTRQEIADMILLLCAGPFANVTGQTLRMDAGWTLPTWEYRVGAVEWSEGS